MGFISIPRARSKSCNSTELSTTIVTNLWNRYQQLELKHEGVSGIWHQGVTPAVEFR